MLRTTGVGFGTSLLVSGGDERTSNSKPRIVPLPEARRRPQKVTFALIASPSRVNARARRQQPALADNSGQEAEIVHRRDRCPAIGSSYAGFKTSMERTAMSQSHPLSRKQPTLMSRLSSKNVLLVGISALALTMAGTSIASAKDKKKDDAMNTVKIIRKILSDVLGDPKPTPTPSPSPSPSPSPNG
ncbi:MAG TPA: hypothetical protein VJ045_09975 [Hyphomicrobiaceae bacterium]|nr:hypothetical protein [Hyphomicrobiaceae bacterium]